MSRRRNAIKRPIVPDTKYHSTLVTRLVSVVMQRGKKSLAQRIVYGAFDEIASKNQSHDPLEIHGIRQGRLAPAAHAALARQPKRGAREPARNRPRLAQPGQAAEERREHVLEDVGCVVRVEAHPPGNGVDQPLVAVEEEAPGSRLVGAERGDERGVIGIRIAQAGPRRAGGPRGRTPPTGRA